MRREHMDHDGDARQRRRMCVQDDEGGLKLPFSDHSMRAVCQMRKQSRNDLGMW